MTAYHPILEAFLKGGCEPLAMRDPLGSSLNGRILEMRDGRARIAFDAGEGFIQAGGVLQGGIVSALLDYGMALAAFGRLPAGRSVATVSLTTHFLRPAPPGAYVASGVIDRLGASMIFASGELHREGVDGPCATGTAAMAISRA